MIAKFQMPFDDFAYDAWVRENGLKVIDNTPSAFLVEGSLRQIQQFAAELDFQPSSIEAGPCLD